MARFSYDCPLRWSDMDAFGHVNNVRFLTLYEEARVALFFNAATQEGLTSFADGCVVARHEIDYLRPVDYGEPVRIDLWVDEIRNSSASVSYELFDGGELASRARSVVVLYDLAAKRPRRVSEPEREFLSKWQD